MVGMEKSVWGKRRGTSHSLGLYSECFRKLLYISDSLTILRMRVDYLKYYLIILEHLLCAEHAQRVSKPFAHSSDLRHSPRTWVLLLSPFADVEAKAQGRQVRLLEMHMDNYLYLVLAQIYSQHALGLKLGFKLRQLGAIRK